MQLVVALTAFLTGFFLIAAVCKSWNRQGELRERLEAYTLDTKKGPAERPRRLGLKAVFQRVAAIFATRSFTEKIQVELLQAGIPLKGEEFVAIWFFIVFGGAPLAWLLTSNLPLAVLVFLSGLVGPRWYLQHKKSEQMKKLNQQLADALVIMANALRAGFGFQQAMETVRREMPPPIANEFEWTLREMQLGSSTEESLQHMSERVKSDDLDIIVTAVLIQRQVGGNLAQILDNITRTIRERTRIKMEIKTLTAQGRLSGLIIGLLPVAIIFLLLIINPGYMDPLLKSSLGYTLLGAAFISEIIGMLVIKKIVDIDI